MTLGGNYTIKTIKEHQFKVPTFFLYQETERSDAFFHKRSRPSSPCPVCTVPLRPFTMEAHSQQATLIIIFEQSKSSAKLVKFENLQWNLKRIHPKHQCNWKRASSTLYTLPTLYGGNSPTLKDRPQDVHNTKELRRNFLNYVLVIFIFRPFFRTKQLSLKLNEITTHLHINKGKQGNVQAIKDSVE